jgi:hypothetical protein
VNWFTATEIWWAIGPNGKCAYTPETARVTTVEFNPAIR